MPNYRWPPQKRLKLYLVEHDIPQAWVSKQTGISTTTLGGIVFGRVRNTPHTRSLIAEALGVPSGSLFTDIEDPTETELIEAADAERWRSIALDDETIEKLRRLLFPQHARGTNRGAA